MENGEINSINKLFCEKIVLCRTELIVWFGKYGRDFPWRKRSSTTYMKVVSEILLKRTRAETIATFLPGFVRLYPSWKMLSMVRTEVLEQDLKPLGLAPTRSRVLKGLAQEINKRGGKFPESREELERLPGIGQYTANAILLFCFKQHQPLLDTNMARVIERIFGPREKSDIRLDPQLQSVAKSIVDHEESASVNWAILDFAATVCKRVQPMCYKCPVKTLCDFFKTASHC